MQEAEYCYTSASMQELTITRPDDWHVHLRDGAALADTVKHTARYFGRAIVMPNLDPPVTTTKAVLAYRKRILACLPDKHDFDPLMTLYLTDATTADEINNANESGYVYGVKLYPAGATTHSDNGVTDIEKLYPCLEAMSEIGMPLLIHGEVTDEGIDIFEREKVFIDTILAPLSERFQQLKIVLEHITTSDAVDFVSQARENIGATITAHHLLYDRNRMLAGGIRPHYYCLPVLKHDRHRLALLDIIRSGHPRFFLGSDSAPHPVNEKESACGCAGCFTAHAAIELYAEAFDSIDALDKLESFASFNGPDFYGLPRNTDKITLRREAWTVPPSYKLGDRELVPVNHGETLQWSVSSD